MSCPSGISPTNGHPWPFEVRGSLPPLGAFTICDDFADILIGDALERRPSAILEAGSGVSTVLLGYCAERNGSGHVYALEHLEEYAEATRRLAGEHGVDRHVTVLYAPLVTHRIGGVEWIWYDTTGVPDRLFEMMVVDGPPRGTGALARYPALPLFAGRLTPNSIVLLDDAHRADEQALLKRWTREFPDFSVERFSTKKGAARLIAPRSS